MYKNGKIFIAKKETNYRNFKRYRMMIGLFRRKLYNFNYARLIVI